jgi:hypothetical protein
MRWRAPIHPKSAALFPCWARLQRTISWVGQRISHGHGRSSLRARRVKKSARRLGPLEHGQPE